jgi:hypothetical protein
MVDERQLPCSMRSFPIVPLPKLKPLLSSSLLIRYLPFKAQCLVVREGTYLLARVVERRSQRTFARMYPRHFKIHLRRRKHGLFPKASSYLSPTHPFVGNRRTISEPSAFLDCEVTRKCSPSLFQRVMGGLIHG